MAAFSSVKWKPRVRVYRDGIGGIYYIAFIYKGKIERRVDDNVKMFRQSAWDDAFSTANQMNILE